MNNKMAFFVLCSVFASASYAMEDLEALLAQLPSTTQKENTSQNTGDHEQSNESYETVSTCIALLRNAKRKIPVSKGVRVIPESAILCEVVVPREQPNPDVQQFLALFQ